MKRLHVHVTTGEAVDYGQGPELGRPVSETAGAQPCCAPDLPAAEVQCCG